MPCRSSPHRRRRSRERGCCCAPLQAAALTLVVKSSSPVSPPFQAVAPSAAGPRQAGTRSESAPTAVFARTPPPILLKEDHLCAFQLPGLPSPSAAHRPAAILGQKLPILCTRAPRRRFGPAPSSTASTTSTSTSATSALRGYHLHELLQSKHLHWHSDCTILDGVKTADNCHSQ